MSLAQLSAKNQQFFKTGLKAVVGASTDRSKFGNKVLRCYQEHSFACVPVNKRSKKIEGLATVESLAILMELKGNLDNVGVSIITPPGVTSLILREGYDAGCRHFYLQPGTYDADTEDTISSLVDANFVKGCVLVDLGFSDS